MQNAESRKQQAKEQKDERQKQEAENGMNV